MLISKLLELFLFRKYWKFDNIWYGYHNPLGYPNKCTCTEMVKKNINNWIEKVESNQKIDKCLQSFKIANKLFCNWQSTMHYYL